MLPAGDETAPDRAGNDCFGRWSGWAGRVSPSSCRRSTSIRASGRERNSPCRTVKCAQWLMTQAAAY